MRTLLRLERICGVSSKERACSHPCIREQHSVYPDSRGGQGSSEVDEDALTSRSGRGFKHAAVGGEKFIARVLEVVPGYARVGVGEDDVLELAVIKGRSMRSFDLVGCVAPAAVDRQDQAALGRRFGGTDGGVRHGEGCKGRTGGFEKTVSIHKLVALRVPLYKTGADSHQSRAVIPSDGEYVAR